MVENGNHLYVTSVYRFYNTVSQIRLLKFKVQHFSELHRKNMGALGQRTVKITHNYFVNCAEKKMETLGQ